MIELRCLGSIDLKSSKQDSATRVLAQPKRYALLAYLALAQPRGFHRRDTLVAMFWPESDDEHARSGLRIALHFLRRELGDDVIVTRGDDVAANEELVTSDVAEFESALKSGALEKALSVYRGDLLPGFHISMSPEFERWIELEREQLKRRAYDAALKLSADRETAGDLDTSVKWMRFALSIAPDDEAVVRRTVSLLDRIGDRAGALRVYESFSERMLSEFEVEPAPETKALVDEIRTRSSVSENFVGPSIPPRVTGIPEESPARRTLPSRHRRSVIIGSLIALAAVTTTGAALLYRRDRPERIRPRIAVIPLQNQTGRSDLDYVGSMATDQIGRGVGERDLGDVVPTNAFIPTTPRALQSIDPVRDIARRTRANIVVSGAYTLEADSLLLRVEINDAQSQRLLAVVGPVVASVARPSEGIALMSTQVVSSVARAFDPRMSGIVQQRGWSKPRPLEAVRASSEGLELFLAAKSRESYEKAIDRFYAAYSLDTTATGPLFEIVLIAHSLEDYARGDSLLNKLNSSRGRLNAGDTDFLDFLIARSKGNHKEAYRIGRQSVERSPGVVWEFVTGYHALSAARPREATQIMAGLNPDKGFLKGVWAYRGVMAEAHHVLGEHQRELELARIEREKQPQLLSTALYEARALAALGRTGELLKLLHETETLAPQSGLVPALPPLRGLSPGSIMLEAARELRAHGHNDESRSLLDQTIAWFRSRLKDDPKSESVQAALGEALYAANYLTDAARVFSALAQHDPQNLDYQGYLAVIAARQGRLGDAAEAAETLKRVHRPYLFGRETLWRARLAAQLGDRNAAMSLLRQSFAEGSPFGIWIHRDIDLEPLRADPSFRELINPHA